MQEPIDLSPELQRQSRLDDLLEMRKHDNNKFFPTSRYEIKDVLVELNLRFQQYITFLPSFDFRILQTTHDFQNLLIPLQNWGEKKLLLRERIEKSKVDYSKPVAMYQSKPVYVNPNGEAFQVFTFEKPKD